MPEKKLQDYIKKIDFSDVRILIVGIVLLIIPLLFLFLFTGSGKNKRFSQERMKTMVNRKSIFNFGSQSAKKTSSRSIKGEKSGGSWFSKETPEKKVQRELEAAFKVVQRSRRSERFPIGTTRVQKEAYRAEHHPLITSGNGALEEGKVAEAAKLFEQAYQEAGDNVFQRVYALGGLCEAYSRMGDHEKHDQAFKLFMEWVAKMPREAGGGDLQAAVRNAYLTLKQLKESADPGKVSQELSKLEMIRDGHIQSANVSRGLSKALAVFPAKFD
ncbi:MAG: hypothetical protein PWR01_2773 [Clostridiales bacterium]|jgi:hypothetical protein|nr:hypothetical protein [Clostridiales bacterium]MDN5281700.1 hypothetical protein [Candidatus Ozemobacter sp.]